jgi:hypothetical protein
LISQQDGPVLSDFTPTGLSGGPSFSSTIHVPSPHDIVGRIIGKGGEIIKRTKCK